MEEKFFLGNPIKTYTLTERMVIQQRIFHYRILLDASLIEKKKVGAEQWPNVQSDESWRNFESFR